MSTADRGTIDEANFDGIVGPTHNYAGLAVGNLASAQHAAQRSNPRAAALQGLAKMRAVQALGVPQGLLPPQERPHLPTLRALGFDGGDTAVLARAAREAPTLLAAVSSASAMWVANAATVSAGADSADGRVHFTPANLCTQLHRAIETATTSRVLRTVFDAPAHFTHHPPLPPTPAFGDEGAANHTRLGAHDAAPGLSLFVYGRDEYDSRPSTQRFPSRQTRLASEAIARQHGLAPARCIFARQHPAAIDAGVFHNDVIAVGHRQVLLYHALAFAEPQAVRAQLAAQLSSTVCLIEISADQLSLPEAVRSYLFNSQLVTRSDGDLQLVVARECEESAAAWRVIEDLIADQRNPIAGVSVVDLRESMHNGGGPACLRLRVPLSAAQRAAVQPRCWLTPQRLTELEAWIRRHYRDRLDPQDLADPQLLIESRTALDALSTMLGIGSVYDFQLI